MKVTRATDYAIRLLAHLAAGEVDTTSFELSKELGVPFNHLAKLVQVLSRKKYLFTRKGKGGGLRLAIDPKKVNLADVIAVIEGPVTISECINNSSACKHSKKCKTRKCFSSVRSRINKILEETSISDLALQYK
jgi:Rrf2 family protein